MLHTRAFTKGSKPQVSKTGIVLERKRLMGTTGNINEYRFTRINLAILGHADDDLCRWYRSVEDTFWYLIGTAQISSIVDYVRWRI